jgi:acetyl esterase/lipase
MSVFHPDLAIGRFIPRASFGPRSTSVLQRLPVRPHEAPEDLLVDDLEIPGPDGAPTVGLRVYRPRTLKGAAPALLWIHGGGMIIGNHLTDEATNIAFARTLGITVASVRYRLSPQHPAPAALDDCYAALAWLVEHAAERGIDPTRIAIGGASAGGGLAAALTLLAHDRGEIRPAFQLLVYPMLDDRTVTRTDMDTSNVRVWTPASNRFAWTSYLGHAPGREAVSAYAAPARREDLSGLPPTWIGVGSLDLFFDEDERYAHRLDSSGVPCEFVRVDGAFHGFDALFPKKSVSKEFWRAQSRALRTGLGLDS